MKYILTEETCEIPEKVTVTAKSRIVTVFIFNDEIFFIWSGINIF